MSLKFRFTLFVLLVTILLVTACGPTTIVTGDGNSVSQTTNVQGNVPQAAPSAQPSTAAPTVIPPTPRPTEAPAQPSNFLLAGSRFPAYANGQLNTSYDLYAEANGRLWQKWLPTTKVAHSVAFELPPGDYIFNGVVARLYLDVNRNGLGSSNPLTVGNGNDLKFTVKLPEGADYKTAWVLVESDGGTPAGFDIWFQGE